jgi:GNAT superfamily N-acetyltransferase
MSGPAISTRPGTPADAEILDHITLASEEPADPPVPGTPGAHVPYLRYLAERGTVVVAEVDGTPVGFGASVRTGRSTHLADLFILPEWQSHGIGRRLLEAVLGDDQPRTTFASSDPRAMPLYLRAGMGAYWPNLYLSGDPRRLPPVDPSVRVVDVDVARVAELDGRWTGADRRPDVAFWASLPEVQTFVIERVADGQPVGAGIARARLSGPGRWMVRGVTAPDADGATVLLAALAHGLAGTELGGVCLPGSTPLARTLLEVGFRIVDRDVFLASDPSIVDPLREIIDSSVL